MTNAIQLWDFHGGIHPAQNKHQSTSRCIAQALTPKKLVLPLNQHIGAPSESIVSIGQHVLKGQMIAKAIGPMSTALHAPTSGTVTDVTEHLVPHPSGLSHACIIIEPDGKDTWVECHNIPDYTKLDRDELIEVLRNAGVAGLGGAGFPSARKIAGTGDDMGTLIINAAECEPYITADDMLMRERATDLVSGIEILAYLVKPKRIIIGIEDNKPEAISALQNVLNAAPQRILNIELVPVPTKYPSGGEKQLIKVLTGLEVPSGSIPADIGIICHNVGTAAAIHQAINLGRPLISRITTVTGQHIPEPRNYEVLLGTQVSDLLASCNYQGQTTRDRLIMGGPMMGFQLPSADVPIIKTTNCILAPTQDEMPPAAPAQACIRCGACSEVCPANLLPQQLYWFSKSKEFEKAEHHNLFDCIECGACSYVCPSSIPLVQYYRYSKGEIRNEREDRHKSEQAKQRFEARQQRLAQEQAEKEARRKARTKAKAAAPKADSKDSQDKQAVAEALARVQEKKQHAAPNASTTSSDDSASAEQITAQIEQTEKRLERSKQRVQSAKESGMDTVDALQAGVAKLEDKLSKLKSSLSNLTDGSNTAKTTAPQSTNDRYSNMTFAQIEKQISVSEQRITTTQQRVEEAQQQGLDTLDALQSGLQKQQTKLGELQAALANKKAEV